MMHGLLFNKVNMSLYHNIIKTTALITMALLILIFVDSPVCFSIIAIFSSVIGSYDLFVLIKYPDNIRFSSILAVSILLGYGLGTAIYLIAHWTMYPTHFQSLWDGRVTFGQEGLSMALAACLLAAALLYVRSWLERPVYLNSWVDYCSNGPKSERILWLGIFIAGVALYTGNIGFMGAVVGNHHHVSSLGSIADIMVPPLLPFVLIIMSGNHSFIKKYIFIAVLIFLVGTLFVLHRRYLLYALVVAAIAWNMRGRFNFAKRKAIVTISLSICAVIILYFGFNFFLAMRLVGGTLGPHVGMIELAHAALLQFSGSQATAVHAMLAKNLSSRTFILSYLGYLMGLSSMKMPAFGTEFIYSIQMSIPSILMPGKMGMLPLGVEDLIHPLYGIPVFDGANSFLTAGYNDFGFIGAVIYPTIIVILYTWYYRMVCFFVRDYQIRIFVMFAIFFQLLFIEQGLSQVFTSMRNLLIVAIMFLAIKKISIMKFFSLESNSCS